MPRRGEKDAARVDIDWQAEAMRRTSGGQGDERRLRPLRQLYTGLRHVDDDDIISYFTPSSFMAIVMGVYWLARAGGGPERRRLYMVYNFKIYQITLRVILYGSHSGLMLSHRCLMKRWPRGVVGHWRATLPGQ